MDGKIFYPRLFGVMAGISIALYILAMNATYSMAGQYQELDRQIEIDNYNRLNTTILSITRAKVYNLALTTGIASNAVFGAGVFFIFWHSLKYMDDFVPKSKGLCENCHYFPFIIGLLLDATGGALFCYGWFMYGKSDVIQGTALQTGGIVGSLIGSILIIWVERKNEVKEATNDTTDPFAKSVSTEQLKEQDKPKESDKPKEQSQPSVELPVAKAIPVKKTNVKHPAAKPFEEVKIDVS